MLKSTISSFIAAGSLFLIWYNVKKVHFTYGKEKQENRTVLCQLKHIRGIKSYYWELMGSISSNKMLQKVEGVDNHRLSVFYLYLHAHHKFLISYFKTQADAAQAVSCNRTLIILLIPLESLSVNKNFV